VKTTLSAGKRLADDEAARLLANANGRVNEGGGNVKKEPYMKALDDPAYQEFMNWRDGIDLTGGVPVPGEDHDLVRQQIAEFAKAVTDGMGSMAKVDEFVEALQSRGGGDVDNNIRFDWRSVPDYIDLVEHYCASTNEHEARYAAELEDATPYATFVDALVMLDKSVDNFHRRYGTASKPNAVENQAKAFAQESGEYIYAIAAGKLDQGAKELADVLYTVFGVAMLAGITREQLADAMYAIAASNDAKTVENGWDWNARGTKVEKLK